jgi:eukaryotic-like serine/threonine-protein kinase
MRKRGVRFKPSLARRANFNDHHEFPAMNPEPDPVESLFAVVLAKPAEERAAFLDQACAGNAVMRQRVDALLKAEAEAGEGAFLTSPHQWASAAVMIAEGPGTRIGPYKLLQQIGEGGMGVVYMAEQEQPVRRRVALKIIKPGMDSAQVIARFEAERQALAMMDHQNIARVLDAGTTPSGRPYFVMELVHGVPITKFCDDNQLTPRQRLELFTPVCQAIQHAHQKGIIHRDVKPSNVLVTLYDDKPVPKVIDFGVSKAIEQRLTEKTLFTQFGTLVGTFEYMSPEQAEMNAFGVDTRSDVYSLGVLLYELLTGTTPLERERLRRAALDEVVRLIRLEEAPRPSARLSSSGNLPKIAAARKTEPGRLALLMRGELDWIVMRCLEKDRVRRYETASALARDVERYLHDEAVEACPPSAGYRLHKFARKNRVALTTAAAFAALLILGAGISAWLAVRANQAAVFADEKRQVADTAQQEASDERDRADREATQVKASATETRRALDHMTVAKGIQLADEGNVFSALPWLVRPLERGGLTPDEEKVHRTRIACYLRYTPGRPRLRQMFFCDKKFFKLDKYPPQIAFSADAKRLLAVAEDTVLVWDLHRGDLLATLQHPEPVNTAQFSPDGTRVFTTSGDATVWIWDAASGRRLGSPFMDWGGLLERPDALLPQSIWQFLGSAAASDPGALARAFMPHPNSIAVGTEISRDGHRALFRFYYGLRLLDLETHMLVGQWPDMEPHALSSDGQTLLETDGNVVRIYDTSARKAAPRSINHGNPVQFVGFSSDGARALSVGKDQAQIWDARTWQPIFRIPITGSLALSHLQTHWSLSPDNRRLAGWNPFVEGLTLWDAENGKLTREFSIGTVRNVSGFDWRPDGKQLLWVFPETPNEVSLLDAASNWDATLALPSQDAIEAVYAPDGRTLATAGSDGVIRVWDLCDRDEAAMWQASEQNGFASDIRLQKNMSRQEWSSEGKTPFGVKTVSGSQERAWLDPQQFLPAGTSFYAGIVSLDQSRVITCHEERQNECKILKCWDAKTRQIVGKPLELTAGEAREIGWRYTYNSVAFSPDSRLFAAASGYSESIDGGKAQLYNAQTAEPVGEPLRHDGKVFFAAFSPDSQLLVTCSEDSTARLWRTQTGEPASESLRHGDMVTCAAFSPNGRILATGSLDGTVRLWEVGSGKPAGVLELKNGHAWDLAFHPNGSFLMVLFKGQKDSAYSTGKTRIFDITSLQEVSPPVKGLDRSDRLQFKPRKDGRFTFGLLDQRSWNLAPDQRPADDLVKLTQLYTQHRLDAQGGSVPLSKQELQALWDELRGKYPAEFAVPPLAAVAWRVDHLRSLNTIAQPVECAFHRRWLAAELAEADWQPSERGNENLLRDDYWQRLQALALHGRHAEASNAADALAARWPKDAGAVYQCACVHALAAGAVKADAALADRYAVRAVAMLRQATNAGYNDSQTLLKDQDLEALRDRDDFKNLLKERFQTPK